MRSITESAEVFEAYATIDCCLYMLSQIHGEVSKPATPLEKMIDECTGYGNEKSRQYKKKTIDLLTEIIRCKKLIDADYKNDQIYLDQLLNK